MFSPKFCFIFLFLKIALAQWSQQNTGSNVNTYQNLDTRRQQSGGVLSPQHAYNNMSFSPASTGGVSIQFQLRSYSNPSLSLPNGNTCVCPAGTTCNYFGKDPPECYFSFTFIISAPDQSVRYFATDFITLDGNGQLSNKNGVRWDENYVVQLPSKPSAIDVFVHHLGAVLNAQDGSPVQMSTLSHVDTFVIPLTEEVPVVGGAGSMQSPKTFTGKILQTQMSIAYSIACSGDFIGPDCDLTCNQSKISTDTMSCKSNSTGFFSVCKQMSGGQVHQCNNCPWGVKENTYCQNENGGVMDPAKAGVVDGSWRVAAIILAVATLVFFILFFILAILVCRSCRRNSSDDDVPGHNYRSSQRTHTGQAERPLLQASFTQDSVALPPQPAPRNTPDLQAKPAKSALRKPPLIPPAHIGGSNSINDSLNSSFMSEVPMRPSRSEVV